MTTFLETPRFPDDIAYGSAGGPGFKTFVFEGHSGIEQRNVAWSRARGKWNVAYGIRDKSAMDTVRALFYSVNGRAIGFRFKDWSDYELTNENIGTGDGTTRVFTIKKTYTSGALSYERRIFKPVSALTVKVNGVTKTVSTHYDIDYTTGILTFTLGNAPTNGHAVTVTGEFDVPVRFDTDELAAKHDSWENETWDSIPIVELLLEEPA